MATSVAKLTPVSRCTTPLSQASPVFDLLLFRSTRHFYTVVHLGLKLHVDVDYPVLISSRTMVECKLGIPRLSVPDFVSQLWRIIGAARQIKSGTESLGSRLSVNYVRAYVIYCA